MPSFTTRLALRKPAGGDNVNVVTDLNDNYDKLDGHVGHWVATSASRPTGINRWQGRTLYETDTKQRLMWNGTTWIYTDGDDIGSHTWAMVGATSGTATLGNATVDTYYERNGRWVEFDTLFTHGSAGTNMGVTGAFNFVLPPFNALGVGGSLAGTQLGTGLITDASTGDRWVCAVMLEDATHHSLVVTRSGTALVSNSVPFAGWAVGDTIRVHGRYRVA